MEIIDNYQPTGIKALGWGFLGFLGSNVIINITFGIGVTIAEFFANPLVMLLTILVTVIVAFWGANEFRLSRNYNATATGITVSMWLQGTLFVLGFLSALA